MHKRDRAGQSWGTKMVLLESFNMIHKNTATSISMFPIVNCKVFT